MKTTNAFGLEIPAPAEMLCDLKLKGVIKSTLESVLGHFEVADPAKATAKILMIASEAKTQEEYESHGHEVLKKYGVIAQVSKKRAGRSQLACEQVAPHVIGKAVLDLGCGNGEIGLCLKRKCKQVTLADVDEHPNIKNLKMPFTLLHQEKPIPFESNSFDTTLLVAVLHHSDFPKQTCAEAYRATKPNGKVVVIETVYGLPPEKFHGLNDEQQRRFNVFVDHFSNRVVQYATDPTKRNKSPYTFQTPQGWKKTFSDLGFVEEKMMHLGFDQPAVMEYHTLHVL